MSPVAGSPMFAFKPAKPDRWWSDESREGKSGGLLMMPMGHKQDLSGLRSTMTPTSIMLG